MKNKGCIFILAGVFFAGGCTTYELVPVPVAPVSPYASPARPQYYAVPVQPQHIAIPVQPQVTPGTSTEQQPLPLPTPGAEQAQRLHHQPSKRRNSLWENDFIRSFKLDTFKDNC